jgi:hypothetical protein
MPAQVATKYKNQFELNNAIEALVKEKDLLNQKYSAQEKEFIRRYSGSGGLGSKGAKGEGVLYEFYTPDYLADLMYDVAYRHGYDGGHILEPSCATGALIRPAKNYSKVVGFEINPVSRRIAEILHPGATIHEGYFETAFLDPPRFTTKLREKITWLKEYPFSMVIGNPPYGLYKNMYSAYFDKKLFRQIEIFFIYQGLQMLKKGGLLVYLISSNFMRNGDTYNYAKDEIGKITDLADAYRLPSVFQFSEVPTDIIVLKRK